ncbi:MAG: preprotein translocase subunit SecY [Candidatus Micrarchaeia archaeon]
MRLDFLKPIVKQLPEVATPTKPLSLHERLTWVAIALVLFFVMYHIFPLGAIPQRGGQFEFIQIVTASRIGSLITTGIGPIILASIFLQLFVGAKMIEIDLTDPEQRKLFTGVQKLLAILLAFFEGGLYVMSGNVPVAGRVPGTLPLFGDVGLTMAIVTFQLAAGSIILLFLDEVVSKYGIGSGISLFIAAGVSLSVVQGAIALLTGYGGIPEQRTVLYALREGGANAIPNAIIAMLPLLFTIIIFLVVTYAEGMKVEIPLAFERFRGFGGRFPIKFLYVSNIPVILASALLLNLQLWGRWLASNSLYVGGADIVKLIAETDASGQLIGGVLYFLTPRFFNPLFVGYGTYIDSFFSVKEMVLPFVGPIFIPEWIHVITYVTFLCMLCVVFGQFWIETTGMGPKEVAEQLQRSGLQVPGFRRDPRIIEGVLAKYIPTITVLGSIFVGLLAAFADLTGALGTGTGILLTVGILHRTYEELQTHKMFELYPSLRSLVGGA